MDTPLYLTADEKTLFDALPKDVRQSWEGRVAVENLTNYETKEQLMERMKTADYSKYPEVKTFIGKLTSNMISGKPLTEFNFDDFPNEALPLFLYTLGATGMTALMNLSLQEAALTPDGLEGTALLSAARRNLLASNAVHA